MSRALAVGLCMVWGLSLGGCTGSDDEPREGSPDGLTTFDAAGDRAPLDTPDGAIEPEGPTITPPTANGSLQLGMLVHDGPATFEQLALRLPLLGAVDVKARAVVAFRRAGQTPWHEAHPLHRIRPELAVAGADIVEGYAGVITGLVPGASYEVQVAVTQGAITDVRTLTASTRALPPESGPATKTVPTGATQAQLVAVLATAVPGDVIELQNGTYVVDDLFLDRSGTEAAPIVIRGASRAGVILSDPTGRVLSLRETSHLVIESLTLQGSGIDSGVTATSHGIELWNGFQQDDVTIRNLDIRGVDMGIIGSHPMQRITVYDCTLAGNNRWAQDLYAYDGSGAPGAGDGVRDGEQNIFWDDDGVRLPGHANVAFNNTLNGFGDAFAVDDGVDNVGIHFYRNEVTMTGDDFFEGDYSVRNVTFYDNRVHNAMTFVSFDPLYGGPAFVFRNVVINVRRGPLKLNNTNTGIVITSNTVVTTNGQNDNDFIWNQSNNGAINAWSFRDNLLIRRNVSNTLALEATGEEPIDFTHNGWFPGGAVWWTNTGGSFASLDAARAALPATTPVFGTSTRRHEGDLIVESDPFQTPVVLSVDYRPEVTVRYTPTLRAGSAPANHGIAIAGVTDGFTGAAPDIGALIAGRPTPTYGDRRR